MDKQEQARRLARVITSHPDEQECQRCLDELDQYVHAQLAELDYQALHQQVAQHLDSCLDCADSYALLYQALVGSEAPEPGAIPRPDLGFLAVGLAELLARAVRRVGAQLSLSLSQGLLELLPRPSGPALALRSGDPAATPVYQLELTDAAEAISALRLGVYREHDEHSLVRVQVELQGRTWPDLEGIPVRLIAGGVRRTALTDAWGEALFEGLPDQDLPGLQLEVDGGAAPSTST